MSKSPVGAALFAGMGGITEAMDTEYADDGLLATPNPSLKSKTGLSKVGFIVA